MRIVDICRSHMSNVLDQSERTERKNLTLLASTASTVETVGGGNISKGVRRLAALYEKLPALLDAESLKTIEALMSGVK